MARRKSTRGARVSRNRDPRRRIASISSGGIAGTPMRASPVKAEASLGTIEAARTKLMRARAVLDCTCFVLLYDDRVEASSSSPSYSDAIDVARDLVGEVIDALDRVNLRRVQERLPSHRNSIPIPNNPN